MLTSCSKAHRVGIDALGGGAADGEGKNSSESVCREHVEDTGFGVRKMIIRGELSFPLNTNFLARAMIPLGKGEYGIRDN